MVSTQTEIESQVIELAGKSFKTFCGDISGMFGTDMECSPQAVGTETLKGLQARFKDLVVAYSVKAEPANPQDALRQGGLNGTFQLVFDQKGLFILAGVVAMHPEQMILEDAKFGSLEKAERVSGVLKEVGTALAGAWDRVFRKELDGHGRFVQTNIFIGNPWDKSEEKIGLAGDEELVFVPYEMTIGLYPTFKCGVILPKAIFDGTSEEETEEKAQEETEETAQEKTEEKTQDQKIAVEKADSDEFDTAQKSDSEESEPQEPTAEMAAAEKTKAEEDTEEATEPEEGAATAEQAQPPAEEAIAADESATKQEPEAATKEEPEAAAEQKPEAATEEEPEAAAEGEPEAATKEEPEAAAEQKPNDVEEEEATTTAETDKSEESAMGGVSETIQKMTQSPAVLPGEPAPSTMAEKPALSSKDAPLTVHAKDIMQKDVIWGNPDDSVQQALTKIQQHDAGYMMIGQGQVPEGVVSKSDLTGALSPYLRSTFAKWRRPLDDATLQIRVKWIMSKPTYTIGPETSLTSIMENMCQAGRRCLPVVDEHGRVQGLVTALDIFNVLLKHSHRR